MLWFNSCPKCGGTVFLEKDQYGLYKQCMQCSYIHDVNVLSNLEGNQENLASTEKLHEMVGAV